MALLDDPTPKDPRQADMQPLLQNLQGNILRSHGRDHAAYLFFTFKADRFDSRRHETLRNFADKWITSASEQYDESQRFKHEKTKSDVFCSLMLSAEGYRALRLDPNEIGLANSLFARGMKTDESRAQLADPPVDDWDHRFSRPIHFLVLVGDDDEDQLKAAVQSVVEEFAPVAQLEFEQRGYVKREGERRVEPFGYADGRSQPIFFADQLAEEGATDTWNPAASLDLVLQSDPFAPGSYGSFFVLRKLEQNVRAFRAAEEALATELQLNGADRERASALIIGRFRDGSPVALANASGFGPKHANDFDYASAGDQRCPLHAHARKANPRTSFERSRRIVRRGMSYDDRPTDERTEPAEHGVGTLFGCYQSHIESQFAHIQRRWLNDPGFPAHRTGLDPLASTTNNAISQKWPKDWGGPAATEFKLSDLVHFKGGEFFFVPSLEFFRRLP